MKSSPCFGALFFCLLPLSLAAQAPESLRLLQRADQVLADGDTIQARRHYQAVLEEDSFQSRAVFQLARLSEETPAGRRQALALYRRYVELEPEDAWGHAALAEAWTEEGEVELARASYQQALRLAPREEEIARAYRALDQERSEPDAGRIILRMESLGRVSRDSEGNTLLRTGLRADALLSPQVEVGLEGTRLSSQSSDFRVPGWEGKLVTRFAPSRSLIFSGTVGGVRLEERVGGAGRMTPLVRLQARWAPSEGPAGELRLLSEPLTATPLLLRQPVVLREARARLDVPISGPLMLRGVGRRGTLTAAQETNSRWGWGGGPLLRLGSLGEISSLYQTTSYQAPSAAGYFAPQRVEALEVGTYLEWYALYPLTVSLDAGSGVERITPHEGEAGQWKPSFRLWSLLGWEVTSQAELRLEGEVYNTRSGEMGLQGESWRWHSLSLSLRWQTP